MREEGRWVRLPYRRRGVPSVWLSIPVIFLSAAAGAWAVVRLSYEAGLVAIVVWFVLSVVGGIGLFMDSGRPDHAARQNDPAARSAMTARLLLLVLAVQLPAVTWRLIEGDPEVRAAKAWVLEIVPDINRRMGVQPGAGGPDGVLIVPEGPERARVPTFIAEDGVRAGYDYGHVWVRFERDVFGQRQVFRYDAEQDDWTVAWAAAD